MSINQISDNINVQDISLAKINYQKTLIGSMSVSPIKWQKKVHVDLIKNEIDVRAQQMIVNHRSRLRGGLGAQATPRHCYGRGTQPPRKVTEIQDLNL